MKNDIENEAIGYQSLIDEIEKEQIKILKELKFVMVGVIGGRKLSDQEYECFFHRTIGKDSFKDIAFNLRISESACKTYYTRAVRKLSVEADRLKYKFE